MTEGVIWKQLLWFALPLMVGNVVQQFYNTVDSIVVGNFVGKEALAAVGSVGSIINSVIGFFGGLATGASVVIAQSYGAKNDGKVSIAVHTTFCMTLVLCVVFTIVGISEKPFYLRLISMPDDVIGEATEYLMIYFSGVSGLMIYNMGAGVLRAVGDSKRPLYFLVFSACVNTVLDLVFVVKLHWGIAGVAWATVIAQGLSAVMILVVLFRANGAYRLVLSKMKTDRGALQEIVRIGFPSAVQQTVTAFSNVFVQSYINSFGSNAMAGWSAYGKIDQFMMLPMQSVALAATTFVGQNLGADNMKRARKGTTVALFISIATALILMAPVIIFAPFLASLFTNEPEVLTYGIHFIRLMMPFYLAISFNQIFANALRGAGNSVTPMVIMMGSFIVFRQIYLYFISKYFNNITATALGYPLGWVLCSILLIIYYWKVGLNVKKKI